MVIDSSSTELTKAKYRREEVDHRDVMRLGKLRNLYVFTVKLKSLLPIWRACGRWKVNIQQDTEIHAQFPVYKNVSAELNIHISLKGEYDKFQKA